MRISINSFLQHLIRRALQRTSQSLEIDGLWVASWKKDDGTLPKVQSALELIKARDPRRYSRMLRDLKGIWVVLLPAALGNYHLDIVGTRYRS